MDSGFGEDASATSEILSEKLGQRRDVGTGCHIEANDQPAALREWFPRQRSLDLVARKDVEREAETFNHHHDAVEAGRTPRPFGSAASHSHYARPLRHRPVAREDPTLRMLQVPEIKRAMGLKGFRLEHGTRRDKVKLLGNGVCSPVMEDCREVPD